MTHAVSVHGVYGINQTCQERAASGPLVWRGRCYDCGWFAERISLEDLLAASDRHNDSIAVRIPSPAS